MIILEENFKWHLDAFASELFIYIYGFGRCFYKIYSALKANIFYQFIIFIMDVQFAVD